MTFKTQALGFLGTVLGAGCLVLAAQGAPLLPSPLPASPPVALKKPVIHQIDANHASKAELMKLPGITNALADKIVQGRPYLSKAHLFSRNILERLQYEAIREHIFVHPTNQMAKEAKARAKK